MHLQTIKELQEDIAARGTDTIEAEARACLLLVLTAHIQTPETFPPVNSLCCPNCDKPFESTRSPYCSNECREIAGFIRQTRKAILDRTLFEATKQEVLGQILWELLGGGRPLRIHLVPDRILKQVLTRDERKCKRCGSPATQIDHIKTGCNRPINLEVVCDRCTKVRIFSDRSWLGAPRVQERLTEIRTRLATYEAVRVCDDPVMWDWRDFLNTRSRILKSDLR